MPISILRDDGLSYMAYTEQITFLLFLKMADEREIDLARVAWQDEKGKHTTNCSWPMLTSKSGTALTDHYADVLRVLREQNVHAAAGQLGQPPIGAGQDFQYTLSTLGRLTEPEQFGNIVLKYGQNGEITYLRDVARIELGARNQDLLGRLDGRPPGQVTATQRR